jgi:ganglioside-induced differentiation-associated protein 1
MGAKEFTAMRRRNTNGRRIRPQRLRGPDMLFLYHGATSVCAAKVRLVLAEKNLAWDGELLDLQRGDQHRPAYRKLNPNAVVPTLVHDGKVLIESTLIIEYLDEVFAAPALMPADAYQRAIARLWMKKIDDYLHAACGAVTFAIAHRPFLLKKTPQELEARFNAMPDPAYRERQRLAVMHGVAAPHVPAALRAFDKYFGEMEQTLARTPWLAGECYSLADVAATPYVNRAELLGMDRLWVGRRPHVADWLARVRGRPNYGPAIEACLSDADRARYDLAREEVWRDIAAVMTE